MQETPLRNKLSSLAFCLFVFSFTLLGGLGCVSISKPSNKIIKTTTGKVIKKANTLFPIQSFVMTRQSFLVQTEICKEAEVAGPTCITQVVGKFNSTASGVIVKTDTENSYILTAGHVCVPPPPNTSIPGEVQVSYKIALTTGYGRVDEDATLIAVDPANDLCLLSSSKYLGPGLAIQETETQLHSKIYNMASPNGLATSLAVPVFDGYYMGKVMNRIMFSVPAAPGSSGSPIMNEDNEIITIISAAAIRFDEFAICPTTQSIREFLLASVPIKKRKSIADKVKEKIDLD